MKFTGILFIIAVSIMRSALGADEGVIVYKNEFYDDINRISAEELSSKMYSIDGKIVKIDFPIDNPKQISKDFFSLNGGSSSHRYVVHIPSEIGQKYFSGKGSRPPSVLFAKVKVTTLVNAFGGESQGALLVGLGTSVKQTTGGKYIISW